MSSSNADISDNQIPLGFALGTFIAIMPTPGFGILIGLFIVFLSKKINKISMLFSFAVWNPLVLAPLYLLSYRLGNLLFKPSSIASEHSVWESVLTYSKTFLFGHTLLAFTIAVVSYWLVKGVTNVLKRRKLLKRKKIVR